MFWGGLHRHRYTHFYGGLQTSAAFKPSFLLPLECPLGPRSASASNLAWSLADTPPFAHPLLTVFFPPSLPLNQKHRPSPSLLGAVSPPSSLSLGTVLLRLWGTSRLSSMSPDHTLPCCPCPKQTTLFVSRGAVTPMLPPRTCCNNCEASQHSLVSFSLMML